MNYIAGSQWTPTHGTLLLALSLEPKEIGQRIAAARSKRGWTQLTFALEADVSPSSVARWESGKLPPVRELMRIAELLDVSPEYLVDSAAVEDDGRFEKLEAELVEVRQSLATLDEVRDAVARIEALLRGAADAARSG